MKRRVLAIALAILCAAPRSAQAREIVVTPASDPSAIEAARAGDVVLIAPGMYRYRVRLVNVGTADAPITIRASDPKDRPVWDLSGKPLEDWPASPGTHRGCWTIEGAYYVVDSVVFRGCRSSRHPVGGIVLEHARHVTMSRLLFEDNDQGMQGDGEDIVLELSELARNGDGVTIAGTNRTHNIYITGKSSFTLRSSYLHDSADGFNVKIDAVDALIEGNEIARGKAGTVAMETANGLCSATQRVMFRGNLVIGSRDAEQEMSIRNVGAAANLKMDLTVAYNTFVAAPEATERPIVRAYNDTMKGVRVVFANNVITGARTLVDVFEPSDHNHDVSMTPNLLVSAGDPSAFVAAGDFRLSPTFAARVLPALDRAMAPTSEPFRDNDGPAFRARKQTTTVGAFDPSTTATALRDALPPAAARKVAPTGTCESCAYGAPTPAPPFVTLTMTIAALLARRLRRLVSVIPNRTSHETDSQEGVRRG